VCNAASAPGLGSGFSRPRTAPELCRGDSNTSPRCRAPSPKNGSVDSLKLLERTTQDWLFVGTQHPKAKSAVIAVDLDNAREGRKCCAEGINRNAYVEDLPHEGAHHPRSSEISPTHKSSLAKGLGFPATLSELAWRCPGLQSKATLLKTSASCLDLGT